MSSNVRLPAAAASGPRAKLGEPERPISIHEQRLTASPGDVREHRFLAEASTVVTTRRPAP